MEHYRELIQFCVDREAGLVNVTLAEYRNLPPIIRIGWLIYLDERQKLQPKNRKS